MACSGPNQEYAHKQAEEAFVEIIQLLKSKYGIDWDSEPYFLGLCVDKKENKAKFRECLKEVFWIDACESW